MHQENLLLHHQQLKVITFSLKHFINHNLNINSVRPKTSTRYKTSNKNVKHCYFKPKLTSTIQTATSNSLYTENPCHKIPQAPSNPNSNLHKSRVSFLSRVKCHTQTPSSPHSNISPLTHRILLSP